MGLACFTAWMILYPLGVSISNYLFRANGMKFEKNAAALSSLFDMALYGSIAYLLYKEV